MKVRKQTNENEPESIWITFDSNDEAYALTRQGYTKHDCYGGASISLSKDTAINLATKIFETYNLEVPLCAKS